MRISRRRMIAGCLLLALPGAGRGTIAPAAWLTRWLAAFNAQAQAYRDFVTSHIPTLVAYLDDDLALREATGGFVLLRSEESGPNEITAWVRDRNWDRFSKVVLSIAEDRIDDLSFLDAPSPAGFAIPRSGERDALAALGRKMEIEAAAGRFSGTVLVARNGTVLFRRAYGAQDPDGARAVTPATRFCLGSMGKMFTAVSVLQLVQAGRVRLTDTVGSLLPAYPDTALARQVTVRHLLTHTGGTGDFFGPNYEAHATELRTLTDFVRLFGARNPLFPPGSRWGYSNFGFILLGAIVEQVSGLAWQEYQERHVFRPGGMSATSPVASARDTAMPLTGAADAGLKTLPYYTGLPAGGGYSTLDDLHRFASALREGRLLDPAHLHLLTTPSVAADSRQWSLGLRIAARGGALCYGHAGSAPGVSADFAVYPASGYAVVVLANRGHPHAANVADYIGARLPAG